MFEVEVALLRQEAGHAGEMGMGLDKIVSLDSDALFSRVSNRIRFAGRYPTYMLQYKLPS